MPNAFPPISAGLLVRPKTDIRLTAAVRDFLLLIDVPAVPESCRRRKMNGGG